MLIVQIKPSAAKTLTLKPSVQHMLPSPGKRLLGILSPGLVPSMDYSISLRALDHTELYLDSQNESSNLQEGVRGCTPLPHAGPPRHPPTGLALWELFSVPTAQEQVRGDGRRGPSTLHRSRAKSRTEESSRNSETTAAFPSLCRCWEHDWQRVRAELSVLGPPNWGRIQRLLHESRTCKATHQCQFGVIYLMYSSCLQLDDL